MKEYAKSCVQPGFDYYFTSRFQGDLSGTLAAFKAARLFLPQNVCALCPNPLQLTLLGLFHS